MADQDVRKLFKRQKTIKHTEKKFKTDYKSLEQKQIQQPQSFKQDSNDSKSHVPTSFFDRPKEAPKNIIEKSHSIKQSAKEKKELQDSFEEFQKEIEPQLEIVEQKEIQEYEELELDKLQNTLDEQYDLNARLQRLKNKRFANVKDSSRATPNDGNTNTDSEGDTNVDKILKASGLVHEDQLSSLPIQVINKHKSIKRNIYQGLSDIDDFGSLTD